MKFEETALNLEKNREIFADVAIANGARKIISRLDKAEVERLKTEVCHYYFERGWGLKILARNVLGVSYTVCRSIFRVLEIEFRKGYAVVTPFLKEFRKEKALHEGETDTGWSNPDIERKTTSTSRGIQGYYINQSTGKYVWLRSSWEYVFAKFLNKIGVKWEIEVTYYKLSDGTKYSPDFYIYGKNEEIKCTVEIKGYFDNRAYKVDLLRDEYFKDSSTKIMIIRDIKKYVSSDTNLTKEIETWKQIRKSKEFISNESN